ncbi:MAG: formylglycine-generating enzyme family protein [Leptospirillia bacterium]
MFAGILLVTAALPVPAADVVEADPHRPRPGQPVAECSDCHRTPKKLPELRTLANDCAYCHRSGTPGLTPVTHLETQAREKGGDITPDPVLARDFATITRDMVTVPGGSFILGDSDRHADEGPMQEWRVEAFFIDRLEVTNADFHRFIMATGGTAPPHWKGHRPPADIADHPLTYVSWYEARDYCNWRGKRLPTEFEWEKAARGEEGLKFPWGDIFDPSLANTPQSNIGHTMPVGSFPNGASPYGALDMAGNVWEWTDSWYQPYPGNTRSNPNYGEIYRIVRGGSWYDCEFYKCGISAPTFNRGFFIPNTKNDTFGFRCAVSAAKKSKPR